MWIFNLTELIADFADKLVTPVKSALKASVLSAVNRVWITATEVVWILLRTEQIAASVGISV